MTRRSWICVSVAALILAGCGGDSDDDAATAPTTEQDRGVVAQVASYELVVDRAQRFLVGLLSEEEGKVSHGAAEQTFYFPGEEERKSKRLKPSNKCTQDCTVYDGKKKNTRR